MALSLKLIALAAACYLAGLLIFKPSEDIELPSTSSSRQIEPVRSARLHPLNQSGAAQIDSILAFVNQLNSSNACLTFAFQLNADSKNRHSETIWSILLARWSQLDPEGMIAFLATEKAAKRPTNQEGLAWQAWAASDPKGAVTRVRSINKKLAEALFKGIAQVDPSLAIELAFQAPDSSKLIDTVLQYSTDFSPETVAHISQLLDLSWIGRRGRKLILEQAKTGDPATDRAIDQKTPKSQLQPLDDFLVELSREQPKEAVALLENDPPSRSRAVSTVEIAKNWALKDPDASLAWVREQSSPQVKNSALVAIASVIGGEDPLRGLSLIEEIGWADTENLYDLKESSGGKLSRSMLRYNHLYQTQAVATSLFRNLAANDPESARQYLAEKIPAEHRPHFEEALKN
jgi:hypothetical protein